MPGEFYIGGKKEKVDLTEIKNTILELQSNVTNIQNVSITQMQNDVAEIKSNLTEIENVIGRLGSSIDLWSPYLSQIQLTSVAGDKLLPSITIADLPSGATVIRAVMMLKYRMIENTNAAINRLDGDQNLQAEKAIDGEWITGIALGGELCYVPASTRESGDVMIGTEDIQFQVPANSGVMDFKWTGAKSTQDSLNFNDVQVGLRIWFKA
jgi:hypothetical protein